MAILQPFWIWHDQFLFIWVMRSLCWLSGSCGWEPLLNLFRWHVRQTIISHRGTQKLAVWHLDTLLLTQINTIPAWISNYIHYKVWDEMTYPFANLGMDKLFHPTLYCVCNQLSMLGLKLIHDSKRGPRKKNPPTIAPGVGTVREFGDLPSFGISPYPSFVLFMDDLGSVDCPEPLFITWLRRCVKFGNG